MKKEGGEKKRNEKNRSKGKKGEEAILIPTKWEGREEEITDRGFHFGESFESRTEC